MASIFGTASPKFRDLDTDAEINFRCRILKDEQDYKEIKHQSIINLHREWNDIPVHWIYECEIYLLKYPENDRKDLYLLLDSYENKVVEFWRRSDENAWGMFRVDEVTPYYFDHPDYPDKIFMRLISTEGFNQDFLDVTVNVYAPDDIAYYPDNTGIFRITRTGSTVSSLTVNFTISGTAVAGVDYESLGTSKVIPAGSASVDLIVTPLNSEPDSDLTIILTLATGSYIIGSLNSAQVNIIYAVPPLIDDLYLWFPDFNLEEEGIGFTWLDEISKVITLKGNYGTGSGIVTPSYFNTKKVLHIHNATQGTFSQNILDYPIITFGGILKADGNPTNQTNGYRAHRLAFDSNNFWEFLQYAVSTGGGGESSAYGLMHQAVIGGSNRYTIGSNSIVDPFTAMIVFLKIEFGNPCSIRLILNDTREFTATGFYFPQQTWNHLNYLGGNSGLPDYKDGWKGHIGEFFYYFRGLTDSEINQLGNYLANKYGLAWIDL